VSATKPERRAAVMVFVRTFRSEHGYGPTYREIAAALGLGVATTQSHVRQLLEAGTLVSEPGKPRTLRPTEENQ